MYSFNLIDQLALQELPNEAARLAIQRWVELTYDGTHPEWKCRPIPTPGAHVAKDLINAIQKNQIDQVSSLVQLVSARMLYVDGSSRRWQHNTTKGFLLLGP